MTLIRRLSCETGKTFVSIVVKPLKEAVPAHIHCGGWLRITQYLCDCNGIAGFLRRLRGESVPCGAADFQNVIFP